MTSQQWGRKTGDLALSISVPSTALRTGQDVVLTAELKNFGKRPVPLVVTAPWGDNQVVVRRQPGGNLPMTPWGDQRVESAAEGRAMQTELAPGASRQDSLELTLAFDVTRPGTYSVLARRIVGYKGGKPLTVVSNELTLHVSETRSSKR